MRKFLALSAALLTFLLGVAAATFWFTRSPRPSAHSETRTGAPPPAAKVESAAPVPSPVSPIRSVDFYNFTYPVCVVTEDTSKVKSHSLKGGQLEMGELRKGEEPMLVSVSNVSYRDLTGDAEEEAIVNLTYLLYPHGSTGCTFIYTLDRERPKPLWHGMGDLRRVLVEDGKLLIEEYLLGPSDAYCCPTKYTRSAYKWDGKRFKEVERKEFVNTSESRDFLGFP